ncbi:MAG TPA: hypothetical protein PLO41_20755 [Rubrivivax sp.]|nr:hypothetical protein [Rubrivivax sp.]
MCAAPPEEAAPAGGFFVGGCRVLLVDSITEAVGQGAGCVVVSGSHGGLSAARFALQAAVRLAVFNDAGGGKDGAGVAGLPWLQRHGIAALAVAHDSARIGEAASTWRDGIISRVNEAAAALGARPGLALRDWLPRAML